MPGAIGVAGIVPPLLATGAVFPFEPFLSSPLFISISAPTAIRSTPPPMPAIATGERPFFGAPPPRRGCSPRSARGAAPRDVAAAAASRCRSGGTYCGPRLPAGAAGAGTDRVIGAAGPPGATAPTDTTAPQAPQVNLVPTAMALTSN